jgi:hypothetical protein
MDNLPKAFRKCVIKWWYAQIVIGHISCKRYIFQLVSLPLVVTYAKMLSHQTVHINKKWDCVVSCFAYVTDVNVDMFKTVLVVGVTHVLWIQYGDKLPK